ncbi:MAG TPA: tannase/feruloyl esterase family alpha/beta hydrolase [Vicinamibacterales bacterium]|jgi:feruloyl esterase|nr:tannase/feruloyl esterase family alpha/beta hydrolase [Vicinamibacterales bacterium]
MESTRTVLAVGVAGIFIACAPANSAAATCESLTSMAIPHGIVTLAQTVAPGAFTAPSGRAGGPGGGQNPFAKLGSFCRVAVTLKPGPQSDIKAEVWLPSAGWNGKLQVVGNGGFAGTISYPAMATALNAGYAAASTDTGHTGPSPNTFANEDVLIDFAYRAIHETAVAAKATVQGFFGNAAKLSYFNGCSTGGRQAVTAAQRYPDDFDGIVAGAPASHTSTQAFGQIWFYQALADPASALPREKLTLLHDAVLNACDEIDGAKDGVLENPLACKFDPQVLACTPGADAASCLTPAQVDSAWRIYAGPSNPRTGEHIFAGLERGSELGWNPVPVGYAVDYFKYIVFKDPNWDPKTLNYDSDVERAGKGANLVFDATSTDMSRFTKRGGKLIMYQGWAEPGIPPGNLVKYLGQIQQKTSAAKDSVRVFMVPGMGHCGGGNGTSTFDMVAALDAWRDGGTAPEQINASRVRDGKVDRTRPLCAWPMTAKYKGTGSIDDAANFVCKQ